MIFLAVNASLRWRNNVSGVYLTSGFFAFYWPARVWDNSSGTGPCCPLAGGLCKFYAKAGGKRPILSAIQAASQSTFINASYTPLVISGNDKVSSLHY
jgi:hypothetical protein